MKTVIQYPGDLRLVQFVVGKKLLRPHKARKMDMIDQICNTRHNYPQACLHIYRQNSSFRRT